MGEGKMEEKEREGGKEKRYGDREREEERKGM